jgi:hypothetical protein
LFGVKLEESMNTVSDIQREEDLICEALVREIGRASRWSARVEAWRALLSTRREGESLRREQEHLADNTASSSPNARLDRQEEAHGN